MDPVSDDNRGGTVASDLGVLHRYLLAIAALLLVIVGAGLVFDWQAVTRVQPTWPEIYPYTVAGMAALVVAMVLFDRGGRGGRVIGRLLAAFVLVLGAGVDLAVAADWLPSSDPASGTASWVTTLPSLATVAIGASVFMLGLPKDRWPRIRFWLAAFAGGTTLLGLLSYVYGSASLFHGIGLTGTSFVTTILGLLVIGATLTARPDRPPIASLDQQYDSALLRRLLPALLVVLFLPALIKWTVKLVDPEDESAEAVVALVTVVILIAIIVISSGGQSRARRAVSSERQRLWDAFANTPAATAMLDLDGRFLLANAAMGRLLETEVGHLIGSDMVDLVAQQDRAVVHEGLAEITSGLDAIRLDVQLLRSNGGTVWVDVGAAPVRDVSGQVTYVVIQCSDLTDRKHLERVLSDQATRDPLTGLLNREGLSRQLRERGSDQPAGLVTTVVYADVDGLKAVNDTIGHAAGDDMLREVARRLTSSTRENDIVARVGGDEFLVITTTLDAAQESVVARLRAELNGPMPGGAPLSVSLGAAILDSAGDVASAVAKADEAMYVDKRRQRATDPT